MRNHITKRLIATLASAVIVLAAQSAKKAEEKTGGEVAKPLPLRAPFEVSSYFFPSGWMGDFKEKGKILLGVNAAYKDKPRKGSSNGLCIKVTYEGSTWAGVYWQYPDGNWGKRPGRTLNGANHVTFWAAGDKGGEVVEFKAGGIDGDGMKYRDTLEVTTGLTSLSQEWKSFDISLAKQDLSNVIGAFACIIHGDASKKGATTIYIDQIRYE
jgi:hypothetical protein